jgi:protein SOK2
MNSGEMYYQHSMSAGQAHPSQTVTSGPLAHYNPHPQPTTLLQPTHQYSNSSSYSNGYYGVASPQGAPAPGMASTQNVLPLPGVPAAGGMAPGYAGFDTTGQIAPPGMKPRVTATLWEDEGSLCFQVETRGICVARREDNHMINGTKLLNVAGMTRGRRDGILKSEKTRHVVKIGPMHLKGVWIPFERALDFANKEKITELLYPLFVHNISALLYHPSNTARVSGGALERRRTDQMRPASAAAAPGLPSIGPHHHHSMQALPAPPTAMGHAAPGRPTMDRAHTFHTPPTPTSATVMDGMPSSNYWAQASQGASAMSIDTTLGGTRSLPTTPAATPPSHGVATMPNYSSSAQPYDTTGRMYQSSQSQYAQASAQDRPSAYGQADSYVKNEMAPPSSRAAGAGAPDAADAKPVNGILQSDASSAPVAHAVSEVEENEQEHDAEYTHNSEPYDSGRGSYNYAAQPVDHSHMSNEMTASPGHPVGSGRATPRTAGPPAPYYPPNAPYSTSPRQSNSVYSVMNDRTSTNGSATSDVYGPSADLTGSMAAGYGSQSSIMNGGASAGTKRGREDDDEPSRPSSGGHDYNKRRRTLDAGAIPPTFDTMARPASAVATPRGRR